MSRALEACADALQQRFGADVACDVVSVDGDPTTLRRSERDLVARASVSHRREFAAGRACARTLLARIGFEPAALRNARDRSPIWPNGAIGSIAYDEYRCAVAVTRAGRLAALGLDIAPDEPLERVGWSDLFLPRELALLSSLSRDARGRVARGLFSAKECVTHCVRAFVRTPLHARDVEIVFARGSERFVARLPRHADEVLAPLEGFQLRCTGSILTGMSVESGDDSRQASRRPTLLGRTRYVAGEGVVQG